MLTLDFIQEQRTRLLEEKKHINKELEFIAQKDSSGSYQPKSDDIGDRQDDAALESTTFDTNLSTERNLVDILNKINAALAKIDKGQYGTCEQGDQIEEDRLHVIPWASTCIQHSN
jgi:DnaK suppressor protein